MTDFPVPAETAKAPKGSAARLVQVAKSQVGYIEGPKDNETKYGAFTKANFQPWCGSFVMWCANEAGVKIPNTVYTPGGAAAFKKAGQWIDGDLADPEPGDIAYFDFPSDGVDRISHVGIVIEDNEDGTVWCIEGNTSGTKKGSQRNGGEACKKLRAFKKNKAGEQISIVGFGRPKFKSGGTAAAKPVSADGKCPTCGK
jgi:cell wall-associated NlpC family hydrolase